MDAIILLRDLCKELENLRGMEQHLVTKHSERVDVYEVCLDKAYKKLNQLEKDQEVKKMTPAEALRAALE